MRSKVLLFISVSLLICFEYYSLNKTESSTKKAITLNKSIKLTETIVNKYSELQEESTSTVANELLFFSEATSILASSTQNAEIPFCEEQKKLQQSFLVKIPIISISKKLLEFLCAIKKNPKYLYEDFEENFPIENIEKIFNFDEFSMGLVTRFSKSNSSSGKFNIINPYAHFSQSAFLLNGYKDFKFTNLETFSIQRRKKSIIQQVLSINEIDVQPISELILKDEELIRELDNFFDKNAPSFQLEPGLFALFDFKNTLYQYDAFWSLYIPFSVEVQVRDIWRGLWAQRLVWLLNSTLEIHRPLSYELNRIKYSIGQNHSNSQKTIAKLVQFLRQWQCDDQLTFQDCIISLSDALANEGLWSINETSAIKAWLEALSEVGYKFPERVKNNSTNVKEIPLVFKPQFKELLQPNKNTILDLKKHKKQNQVQFLKKKCSNYTNATFENLLKHDEEKLSNLNDITLLVTFNFGVATEHIKYLFSMYGDYFGGMVLCGINATDAIKALNASEIRFFLSALDLDNFRGFYHFDCLVRAIQMNFNTRGILLMSDDVLIKPWNMRKLSLDKVWAHKNRYSVMINSTEHPINWHWWRYVYGKQSVNKAFDRMFDMKNNTNDKVSSEIVSKYFEIYAANTGSDFKLNTIYSIDAPSDIFYVPRQFFKTYETISPLYSESTVFLEIAVPMILYGLDKVDNMEFPNFEYVWRGKQLEYKVAYSSFKHGYHPAKISHVESNLKNKRNDFCNFFIYDKLNEFLK